ncbi:hypothetical protein BKA62DRAFT_623655 [Auriculariales sp. MPI-PUGE-AT-0066]|nr:hypothetical protein BKA62DRAFT_623655 [Auriculariales sp. MPI-PUGE-AT-0066]
MTDILAALAPSPEVIRIVLVDHVKPRFSPTPHPDLSLDTGRRLRRPAGGPAAAMDMFDGQLWKQELGTPATVLWCTAHVSGDDFESLWHLLIPPIMTMLDDYETRYKIWGVRNAAILIDRAPPVIIKRTGIGALLHESLCKMFMHLHDPETPALLRISTPTYIRLVNTIYDGDSAERLDRLFHLLGQSVIGTVWGYASQDEETINATIDLLPSIFDELGISTCRYLKFLVPQLIHPMTADPVQKVSAQLYLASLSTLRCLMRTCQERIPGAWSTVIITSLSRGWIKSHDVDADTRGATMKLIREELRSTLGVLFAVSPSAQVSLPPTARLSSDVLQVEYDQIRYAEPDLFRDFMPMSSAASEEQVGE